MKLQAPIKQKTCKACGGTKFFQYWFNEDYKGDLKGFEFEICAECGNMDMIVPVEDKEM